MTARPASQSHRTGFLSFCCLHYWSQCPGHLSSLSLSSEESRALSAAQQNQIAFTGRKKTFLVGRALQHILERLPEQPFVGKRPESSSHLGNSGWWPWVTRIPTLRFCYSNGQGTKIWTVKTLTYLVSLDQGSGKEKCSQWLWGQLIRNLGWLLELTHGCPWRAGGGG